MDAGGRATQEAKAEAGWGCNVKEPLNKSKNSFSCHTGEGDLQDVGNVARGHDVRSDQYPVNNIFYSMSVLAAMAILLFTLAPNAFADDDLGRLFTTPQQRNTLEKLRHQKPVEEKAPEIIFMEPEPEVAEEKPVIGGITVNGLVYRKGNKSTAWVNSANTYEGNFANQYIQIDAHNIKPEDVEILIPINETKIKLKTGQTYDPEADKIISPGYQDN